MWVDNLRSSSPRMLADVLVGDSTEPRLSSTVFPVVTEKGL